MLSVTAGLGWLKNVLQNPSVSAVAVEELLEWGKGDSAGLLDPEAGLSSQ